MGTKVRSRFIVRLLLALLLLGAVANAVFVFHFDPEAGVGQPGTMVEANGIDAGIPPEMIGHETDWKYFSRATWRGEIAYKQEKNGSYSFRITSSDLRGPFILTGQEGFIRKASGKEEQPVRLEDIGKGVLLANYTFPEPGEWVMRVRLTRALDTLEFSQTIDVK